MRHSNLAEQRRQEFIEYCSTPTGHTLDFKVDRIVKKRTNQTIISCESARKSDRAFIFITRKWAPTTM